MLARAGAWRSLAWALASRNSAICGRPAIRASKPDGVCHCAKPSEPASARSGDAKLCAASRITTRFASPPPPGLRTAPALSPSRGIGDGRRRRRACRLPNAAGAVMFDGVGGAVAVAAAAPASLGPRGGAAKPDAP